VCAVSHATPSYTPLHPTLIFFYSFKKTSTPNISSIFFLHPVCSPVPSSSAGVAIRGVEAIVNGHFPEKFNRHRSFNLYEQSALPEW